MSLLRYLSPGECIVHDRGAEFCNNLIRILSAHYGVEIRVIKAGRPMANGQAEAAVKLVKNKMKTLTLENSDTLQII